MIYLSKQELDVLEVLADMGEHEPVTIASETELHPQTVRSVLADLRRRFLVSRDLAYRVTITDTGLKEWRRHRRQMRMV